MNKKSTLSIVALLLVWGTLSIQQGFANPVYEKPGYDIVTFYSPQNQSFISAPNVINLNGATAYFPWSINLHFTDETDYDFHYLSFCYTIDGNGSMLQGAIWNDLGQVDQTIIKQVDISNDTSGGNGPFPTYTDYTYDCSATLPPLSDGMHNVTVYRGVNYVYNGAGYTPYGTVYFTVDAIQPNITLVVGQNKTYNSSDVLVNFTVNKSLSRFSYSLDGLDNVTFYPEPAVGGVSDLTLNGLSNGLHNITLYAWDGWGDFAKSETISFTITKQPSSTSTPNPTPTSSTILAPSPSIPEFQPCTALIGILVISIAVAVAAKKTKPRK